LSIHGTTPSGNIGKLSLNERRFYGKVTGLKLHYSEVYTHILYEISADVSLEE
jgi:hypothetical protein